MRLLAPLLLALVMAAPASAGQTAITAGPGPFHHGGHYATAELVASWSAKRDLDWWARILCAQEQGAVLDAFQSLSRPVQQDGVTLDSLYWTAGPATCSVNLVAWTGQGLRYFASDTFEVGA